MCSAKLMSSKEKRRERSWISAAGPAGGDDGRKEAKRGGEVRRARK